MSVEGRMFDTWSTREWNVDEDDGSLLFGSLLFSDHGLEAYGISLQLTFTDKKEINLPPCVIKRY